MLERDNGEGGGAGVTSFSMFLKQRNISEEGAAHRWEQLHSAGKIHQRCRNTSEVGAGSTSQQHTAVVQLETSAWCSAVTCPPSQVARAELLTQLNERQKTGKAPSLLQEPSGPHTLSHFNFLPSRNVPLRSLT